VGVCVGGGNAGVTNAMVWTLVTLIAERLDVAPTQHAERRT
jgi:hypothetical protein